MSLSDLIHFSFSQLISPRHRWVSISVALTVFILSMSVVLIQGLARGVELVAERQKANNPMMRCVLAGDEVSVDSEIQMDAGNLEDFETRMNRRLQDAGVEVFGFHVAILDMLYGDSDDGWNVRGRTVARTPKVDPFWSRLLNMSGAASNAAGESDFMFVTQDIFERHAFRTESGMVINLAFSNCVMPVSVRPIPGRFPYRWKFVIPMDLYQTLLNTNQQKGTPFRELVFRLPSDSGWSRVMKRGLLLDSGTSSHDRVEVAARVPGSTG